MFGMGTGGTLSLKSPETCCLGRLPCGATLKRNLFRSSSASNNLLRSHLLRKQFNSEYLILLNYMTGN